MTHHAQASSAGLTWAGTDRLHDRARLFLAFLAIAILAIALAAPLAAASKSVVGSFGIATPAGSPGLGGEFRDPQGIAVNNASGDIYVVDRFNNRIQRFDSEGDFISAWGFDTIQEGKPGNLGSEVFEVCTVAADCKEGITATVGGFNPGGELSAPQEIAIDQASGNLYVHDSGFLRVSVFSASGAFIRAFGQDVVQEGKPGDLGSNAFEVCTVAADCKTGVNGTTGGAFGSLFSLNGISVVPAGGTAPNPSNVLVTDRINRRVQEFTSSGAFVRTFGFDVVESGPGNTGTGFEVCNAGIDVCKAAAEGGPGIGQFGLSGPRRAVEDSTGTIYTAERAAGNFRVQKFTLPGNVVTPAGLFAPALFTGTTEGTGVSDIAIDPSDNLVAIKGYPEGETPYCLGTGAPSVQNERRVLEVSPAGALLDTHLACAGITNATGIALDPAGDRVYLSSTFPTGTSQVYVLDDVGPPPSATIDPVTEFDAFSATLEGEVDPQGSLTECRFDYITKAAFDANVAGGKEPFTGAAQVPCESSPGSGTGPIAVRASAAPLVENTPYKVRLVAFNAPFRDIAAASPTEEFTTATKPPPTVITGAVAPRGTTTARLHGLVNPNNSPTKVHFEYGTAGPCSANPCESTPEEELESSAFIPPGQPFTSIVFELEGLEPNTTYHYRLVGTNEIGTKAGADRTFATLPIEAVGNCPNEDVRQRQHSDSYLGHCRAIELVNQPDKGNQNVFSQIGFFANPTMTEDGEGVLWNVFGGAPGGTSSAGNFFFAERSAGGWRSRGLVPPAAQQLGNGSRPYAVEQATPGLGAFIFNALPPDEIALAHGKALIRLDRDQHQEVLASYDNFVEGTRSEVSDDGSHVLVVNPDTLQLEDIGDGTPEPISLLPPPGSPLGVPVSGGTPSTCGLKTTGESFAGVSGNRLGAGNHWNPGYRMIAAEDASRVYFQVQPDGDCGGTYGLYVRNRESDETIPIDYGASGRHVEFIRATPDGRSAYFVTFSQLDPGDQNTGADVYRWDEQAGESSCLTCVVAPNANVAFLGIAAKPVLVSDDFSHVYFQSKSQLVPGHGEAGTLNTYALSGGEIRFVAGEGAQLGLEHDEPKALLSPDGNVLVFLSELGAENLTADPLPAQCADTGEEAKPCQELYRYDDRDGSLECISCRHDGETTFSVQPFGFRMSADGRTVAFVTPEALLPQQDVNQSKDIYEWRDGAVHLISDGVRTFSVGSGGLTIPEVRGIDADGQSILFALLAPGLTGFEHDGQRNLYVARIGGGFLPPDPPVHCAEDSCQGPLQAAPAVGLATSSDESRGNVVEPRKPHPCAKKRGKARRRCIRRLCAKKHGEAKRRCISKHRRRLQRARANHDAGGAR